MSKSSGQRRGAIRHIRLLGLAIVGVLALPVAVAHANDTWTGASSSPQWSTAGNWTAGVPTGAAGTLTFPDLAGCAAPATCYTTQDGLSGITASGLVFGNASNQYKISGQGLTIGAGGIDDTPGHGTSVLITAPLALSAGQTWKVGAIGAYNNLNVTGGVTGSSSALGVVFTPLGSGPLSLYVVNAMEVGPVTVNGFGGLHLGGPPTSGHPGTVNASDGNPTTITGGATLVANPGSKVGTLNLASGTLLLGTNPANNVATTLAVSGTASIDAQSTTNTFINNNGSNPGTDFSQLSASGNITLAGRLNLGQGPLGPSNLGCASLIPGDVATLFTTSGTLRGTFANATQDGRLTLTACGSGTAPQVRIHYSANSVTATVISGTTATTTTLAPPNPSPAATNQPVTLTATVTAGGPGSGTPSGAVQFVDGGAAIPGCDSRPLTAGSSGSASATCTVSYSGAGSHSITASYGGDANFGGSSSPATSVIVQLPGPSTPTPSSTPTPTPTPSSTPTPAPAASSSTSPGHAPPASTTRPSSSGPPRAISASTSAATRVGTTEVTVTGRISTGGGAATWKFQYGRSSAYGRATRTRTIAVGRRGTVMVSAVLRGLSPRVRYYYRLVVSPVAHGARAKYGRSHTFTTVATGRLTGPAPQLTVTGQTIAVAHTCVSAVPCVGRLTLTTTIPAVGRARGATVVCATGGFRIAAHRTVSARLTLTAACLSRVRALPLRPLVVTDAAQPATGQLGLRLQITLVLGRSTPMPVIH